MKSKEEQIDEPVFIEAVNADGEVTETQLSTSPVVLHVNSKEELDNLMSKVETLDKMTPGISMNPRYYDFKNVGDKVRGVFTGYRTITVNDQKSGEKKQLEAVGWLGMDKQLYLNAGVALVRVFLDNNTPVGSPVEIEMTETKKGKAPGSTVKIYNVTPLL